MSKYTEDDKLSAVQSYLNGIGSYASIGAAIGTTKEVIRNWVKLYEQHGLDVFKKSYTTYSSSKKYCHEALKQIARKHLAYFYLRGAWDEYARVNNLPCSSTYSKYFGSWKEALKSVGIQPTVENPSKYTKKHLVLI